MRGMGVGHAVIEVLVWGQAFLREWLWSLPEKRLGVIGVVLWVMDGVVGGMTNRAMRRYNAALGEAMSLRIDGWLCETGECWIYKADGERGQVRLQVWLQLRAMTCWEALGIDYVASERRAAQLRYWACMKCCDKAKLAIVIGLPLGWLIAWLWFK